jgi:hypothetical protein
MVARNDKRDTRDPVKLYERIKKIQESNPGASFREAADMADQMYMAGKNGACVVAK